MKKPAKPASWTVSKLAPAPQTRQALGGFEAAAVMGVHFTIPYRMADRGKLAAHTHETPEGRRLTFFDGEECERNYLDYAEAMASEGGTGKRPRGSLSHRKPALRYLASVKHKIQLSDAISTPEAVEILGMHASYALALARKGEIVARQLWSPRGSGTPSQWMFSRKSCLENLAKAREKYSAGKMQGRVRGKLRKHS